MSDGRPHGEPVPRLAVFGDIHANLRALTGVLRAIDGAGITTGICTGDVVMRGPEPGGCIDALVDRGWPCAQGNTDHKVGSRSPRSADHPKARRVGSRSWTSAHLEGHHLAWLAALPRIARAEFAGHRVCAVHGTPESPQQPWDASTPDTDLVDLARQADAQIVVSGHTHVPVVRRVGELLFVNPGSVGEALGGDLRPRWCWLEATDGKVMVHLEHLNEPLAVVRQFDPPGSA